MALFMFQIVLKFCICWVHIIYTTIMINMYIYIAFCNHFYCGKFTENGNSCFFIYHCIAELKLYFNGHILLHCCELKMIF